MLPRNFMTHGSLVVPDNSSIPLVFPGVRGKIKKTIPLAGGRALEANSLAIIQPLNLDKPEEKQRFRLTPYVPLGSNRDDLPENQRNISIDEKNSCEVELDNPTEYLGYIEQYQQSEAPLFGEGSPSIEDVRQYKVPDCFLLASLGSILTQPDGASFIRSMLRQNDDGTTTVRLFNPKTLEPVYVRVENSYIVDHEGSLNNHTGLWVDILEKAAASVPEFFGSTNASMSGALKGGSESTALKILTGCHSEEEFLSYDRFFAWDIGNFFADELLQLDSLFKVKKLMQAESPEQVGQLEIDKIIAGTLSPKISVFKKLFDENAEEICLQLIDFYLENKDKWEEIYTQYSDGQQRLEKIIEYFSQDEKNTQAVDILKRLFTYYHKDVAKGVRRDNQRIYSGIYSPEELQVFNDIEEKIAAGESLTAGTPHRYDEKVPGLRATHAYTIVGVFEQLRPDYKDENKMRPIKMIRIRNPWGVTGRLYLPNMDDPTQIDIREEREAGIFDLELKEFCRYYQSYTSTQQFSDVRVLTEKRERLALKMLDVLKEKSSSDRLIQLNAFFECKDELIEIQKTTVELLNDNIHQQITEAFSDKQKNHQEVQASLNKIIEANKTTMMNLFQTSDCQLIAASITYWWKSSNQEISQEDEKTYQQQLIESVEKNNVIWKKFIKNYPVDASVVLQPLNDSIRLITELFVGIEQSQRSLRQLTPGEEGYKEFLRALLIQAALLQQHFNYLEKYEQLLQRFDIKINTFREQLEKLNADIEELVKDPIAEDVKKELETELPPHNLDDFTEKAKNLIGELANMELVLNRYHEENLPSSEPNPRNDSEKQQSGYLPQWVIDLENILRQVLKALAFWKKSKPVDNEQSTKQTEYNRDPESDKYPGLKKFGFFVSVSLEDEPLIDEVSLQSEQTIGLSHKKVDSN